MKIQKSEKAFQVLKIEVVLLFLLMLLIRVYVNISFERRFQDHHIFWPLSFIFVTVHKSKLSWLMAICLFIYGIYYYLIKSHIIAYPDDYEFMQPLNELLYGDEQGYHTGYILQRYLHAFPFLFYVIGLITFLTNPVRKRYWKRNF